MVGLQAFLRRFRIHSSSLGPFLSWWPVGALLVVGLAALLGMIAYAPPFRCSESMESHLKSK